MGKLAGSRREQDLLHRRYRLRRRQELPPRRERHPELALALVPIGAYEPRWFMRDSHINPEEAVHEAMRLSGAPRALGHHWGTFRLTDEAVEQPMLDTSPSPEKQAASRPEHFPALRPGEVRILG